MADTRSILMVLTSVDRIDAEHTTGVWFEEFATPYNRFLAEGYVVTVASIKGGQVPIDPRSEPEDKDSLANQAALEALTHTDRLMELDPSGFDGVFFPGGHGTMFDFPRTPIVSELVGTFLAEGRVVSAVCHGPAAFVNTTYSDGTPIVKGRRLTCFTNREEAEVQLDQLMPFLLESRLREQGGDVRVADNWSDHVVTDGRLVTGQNPQSSRSAAEAVIRLLNG